MKRLTEDEYADHLERSNRRLRAENDHLERQVRRLGIIQLLAIAGVIALLAIVAKDWIYPPEQKPTLRITEHWPDKPSKTTDGNAPFPPCTNPITVTPCNGPALIPTDAERARWEKLKQEGNQ